MSKEDFIPVAEYENLGGSLLNFTGCMFFKRINSYAYLVKGKQHREMGPAVWSPDLASQYQYWLEGKKYDDLEYWQEMLKRHPDQEELILSHILCNK